MLFLSHKLTDQLTTNKYIHIITENARAKCQQHGKPLRLYHFNIDLHQHRETALLNKTAMVDRLHIYTKRTEGRFCAVRLQQRKEKKKATKKYKKPSHYERQSKRVIQMTFQSANPRLLKEGNT